MKFESSLTHKLLGSPLSGKENICNMWKLECLPAKLSSFEEYILISKKSVCFSILLCQLDGQIVTTRKA